jgi:peptidoglycan LD-endopeptidase LytH
MKLRICSWRALLGSMTFCVGAALMIGSSTTIWAMQKPPAVAKDPKNLEKEIYAQRKEIFDKVSTVSGIPWSTLAAVDQYERNMNVTKKRNLPPESLLGIYFSELEWSGLTNPDSDDSNPMSISFFKGKGKDGSGDGLAQRNNDLDRMAAMVAMMLKHGNSSEDIRIALWDYYQNSRSVERIEQFARLYDTMNSLDLRGNVFPLPIRAVYSYRSTWGASRGWGGFRIHEGTDIFARHGTPVLSTSYGIIEEMGWNPYGGWRIGIRDINSVYHYYAHLSGFNKKEIKEGSVVKPGQEIGWVGSSGYGKPGTSGKFPPHLHFGMY